MAWIEVHQTLPSHRKIKKLKRLLKIKAPQAVGHMVMLWLWAIDNTADGRLDGLDREDIAEAAEWSGNPDVFLNALISAGFVDEGDGLLIHDWQEYAGRLMDKRDMRKERDRERQRAYRRRKKGGDAPVTDVTCHTPVTRDSPVTDVTCHTPVTPLYSTVPYHTVPYHGDVDKTSDDSGAEQSPPLSAVDAYMKRISPTPSTASMRELMAFEREMDTGCCLRAIDAALDANKRTWPYVKAVLESKKAQGVRTVEDWDRLEAAYQDARHRRVSQAAERTAEDAANDRGDLDLLLTELRAQGVEIGGEAP